MSDARSSEQKKVDAITNDFFLLQQKILKGNDAEKCEAFVRLMNQHKMRGINWLVAEVHDERLVSQSRAMLSDYEASVDLVPKLEKSIIELLKKIRTALREKEKSLSSEEQHALSMLIFFQPELFSEKNNFSKVMQLAKKSAEKHSAHAKITLSWLCRESNVPEDKVMERQWLESAAAQQHADAQNELAIRILKSEPDAANELKAVVLLESAVSQGDSAAQFNLSYRHKTGKLSSISSERAMQLMRLSAEQDYSLAQHEMARHYKEDKKSEHKENEIQSMKWLLRACKQYDYRSLVALNSYLLSKVCYDPVMALACLELAKYEDPKAPDHMKGANPWVDYTFNYALFAESFVTDVVDFLMSHIPVIKEQLNISTEHALLFANTFIRLLNDDSALASALQQQAHQCWETHREKNMATDFVDFTDFPFNITTQLKVTKVVIQHRIVKDQLPTKKYDILQNIAKVRAAKIQEQKMDANAEQITFTNVFVEAVTPTLLQWIWVFQHEHLLTDPLRVSLVETFKQFITSQEFFAALSQSSAREPLSAEAALIYHSVDVQNSMVASMGICSGVAKIIVAYCQPAELRFDLQQSFVFTPDTAQALSDIVHDGNTTVVKFNAKLPTATLKQCRNKFFEKNKAVFLADAKKGEVVFEGRVGNRSSGYSVRFTTSLTQRQKRIDDGLRFAEQVVTNRKKKV